MTTLIFSSPGHIIEQLAQKLRARRLAENWSRKTLAERSGVSEGVIKRFESSGSIRLEDLVQLAVTLDAAAEFGALFPERLPTSIEHALGPVRRRGRQ